MKQSGYKRILSLIAILTLFITCLPIYAFDYQKKDAQINNKQEVTIGKYISFGRYNDEPIIWQVIHEDKEGNQLLVANNIITFKAFDAAEDVSADYRNVIGEVIIGIRLI